VSRRTQLAHQFVEYIPQELSDGTIYVSIPFATVVHKCCCGCGSEVVTPLSPTDWQLTFDGETISIDPSIGNWSFACQSHYWIRRNRVNCAPRWSKREIEMGRANDRLAKKEYLARIAPSGDQRKAKKGISWWKTAWGWLERRLSQFR
jgi:hypothetical protein